MRIFLLACAFLVGCSFERIEEDDPHQCVIPVRIIIKTEQRLKFYTDEQGNLYLETSNNRD